MARGDVTVFNDAKAEMLIGGWAGGDTFKLAICDNTLAPSADTTAPSVGAFTEVGTGGSYSAGGYDLGIYQSCVAETGGTMTFTSAVNPTCSQDAGNDTDAYWGIIYNATQSTNAALAFVDLGGPVDGTAGDLTITWNASGIFTIT